MIPNDCRREAGVLKQVNVFGAPYLTDPQTPGLDPPLYPRICSSSSKCTPNRDGAWQYEINRNSLKRFIVQKASEEKIFLVLSAII